MEKTQFVRDLKDKEEVNAAFLVKFSQIAVGKTGKPYVNLVLGDRSGEIEARLWDQVSELGGHLVNDALVSIQGRCQNYQGRKQIVIKSVQVLREDEVNLADFTIEGRVDAEALHQELLKIIETMKDPHYRALAEVILRDDPEVVTNLKVAPAAKSVHHAYKGGLLEHIVSISHILDSLSQHYGDLLDRDLLLLGGFFHDIAKIWELSYGRSTDYTDEGRLVGHLVMGVELIEEKIQALIQSGVLKEFPKEKKLLVKHLVLSHHGKLEYGSPKRPKCLEALVVHYVDDLDSKINSIKDFYEKDLNLGSWTGLHRHFERYFYKPEWARKTEL